MINFILCGRPIHVNAGNGCLVFPNRFFCCRTVCVSAVDNTDHLPQQLLTMTGVPYIGDGSGSRKRSIAENLVEFVCFSVIPDVVQNPYGGTKCGADIFFNASSAFSALLSCATPITALIITISKINAGSKNSFGLPSTQAITNDIIAAIINIIIIASLNCSTNL